MAYFLVLVQFQVFSAAGAIPADVLAYHTTHIAEAFGVEPQLAAAVILAESGGRAGAINSRTHDYGLMQINERQATQLRINKKCLMEWRCNMVYGIQHLSKLKRPCQYNVGQYRHISGRFVAICEAYEAKLAKFVLK